MQRWKQIILALVGFAVGFVVVLFVMRAANAQAVNPDQMYGCTSSAIYDTNTNGSTKLVSGVAGKRIYVCGFVIYGGGTANVKFVYGTKTTNDCDTGTTSITPAFAMIAQARVVDHPPVYTGLLPAPASNDVCINASAGVAIQAILYYTQF